MFDRFYGGVITLGMKQISSSRYKYIIFAILYIMFVARIQFGIDLEDEAYQVSSYYQIWQGKIPLMSIWDGHTGYFLLAPFCNISLFCSWAGWCYYLFSCHIETLFFYFRCLLHVDGVEKGKIVFVLVAVACFTNPSLVYKNESVEL